MLRDVILEDSSVAREACDVYMRIYKKAKRKVNVIVVENWRVRCVAWLFERKRDEFERCGDIE